MVENNYDAVLVKKSLEEGKRLSDRALNKVRDIYIEKNVIKSADGSAIVTLGKTKVIAGVKGEITTPFPDTPNEGSITVGVEMSPMADPNFESGPPSAESIELSRVVDRGIREAKAIDFGQLCVVPGEKVWTLYCDIYIINNEGNLFDACALAALAAFQTTVLPQVDSEGSIIKDSKGSGIKLKFNPILFTFSKIGDKIILDPDLKEESAAEARYSVAITEEGKLTAMQKGLNGTFTFDELLYMIQTAKSSYKDVVKAFN